LSTIARLIDTVSPKAGSLIITVFGDAIAPRGGELWLGSLIALLEPIGLSERLVRTGVYRLAREGWLTSRSRGRRSFYAITGAGLRIFAAADKRIYSAHAPAWDGRWLIAHLGPGLGPRARTGLRRTLRFDGFGELSPTLLVRPSTDVTGLNSTLVKAKAGGRIALFTATLAELTAGADARTIAASAWHLDDINLAYDAFIGTFAGYEGNLPAAPQDQFVVQTLLIHQYRRILLQDPQLPGDLLPSHWLGTEARALTARLYRGLAPRTAPFIAARMETWDTRAVSTTEGLEARFA
jgi:phenylacetic acid degradation operon negative regulatory protein